MTNITKNRILRQLATLQFAITLLFTIGFMISVGTVIEQDQSLTFYKTNYPETNPMFGFLTWTVIKFFNLDQVYSAWWFLTVLFLFGSSLLACTFTTQLPSIKTFKIWKFLSSLTQYKNLSVNERINFGFFNTTAYNCNRSKYHFFRQKNKGYAYSGLLGRVAPIMVHVSIIVLLLGSSIGSVGGYMAQELVPRGEIFHIQNVTNFGNISTIPQDISCRINDFWITYTNEFKTDQFYSDLSIIDEHGKELKRKTVFVNEPLNFNDLVFYQTDWDIVGLKLRLNENQIFQVPVKKITKGGGKFWFGNLNLENSKNGNLTFVINDLKGKLSFYNSKGSLIETLNIGNSISLNEGERLQFLEYITSTGLQIKSDPGIFTIYFSFLLLMISIYVSFFTYSQIWLIESQKLITIGGKSNRAVLFFQEEFRKILKLSMKSTV